jgi:hypothetical protein
MRWKTLREFFTPVAVPDEPPYAYTEDDMKKAYFAGVEQEKRRPYNTADVGYEVCHSIALNRLLHEVDNL